MAIYLKLKCIVPLLAASLLLSACATTPTQPKDLEDPAFISWYKTASPYMRTAFFMSLCIGSGFSRGSVDVTICLSNYRSKARVRLEGEL